MCNYLTMSRKNDVHDVEAVFADLKKLGIDSVEKLSEDPELKNAVWMAVCNFVCDSFRTSDISWRLNSLERFGVDREDVGSEALVRCMRKLEKALNKKNPKGYLYNVIRNVVKDAYRVNIKQSEKVYSMDKKQVSRMAGSDDMGCSLADFLRDRNASPELICHAKMLIQEIYRKWEKNQDRLLVELSDRFFEYPPRTLSEILVDMGSVEGAIRYLEEDLSYPLWMSVSEFPSFNSTKNAGFTKTLGKDIPAEKCAHELSRQITILRNHMKQDLCA